jgi:hypothetical protein
MYHYKRVIGAIVAVWAIAGSPAVLADESNLAVVPPSESFEQTGSTYGELSAAWWRTMLAIPQEKNPSLDTSGINCPGGDTPRIFFLAGQGTFTPVTRSCTVPADKPLFFPIINVECSNIEAKPFFGATDGARSACARKVMDGTGISTLKVTLDGIAVPNLSMFRAASPPFNFTIPPNDNILFLGNGETSGRSASDGFWVLVRPPHSGQHVIHFEGAFARGVGAGLAQDVTYHLTVT